MKKNYQHNSKKGHSWKIFHSFKSLLWLIPQYSFVHLWYGLSIKPVMLIIDMFKQHENPLCICYSTQKSDIGTVVELGNLF